MDLWHQFMDALSQLSLLIAGLSVSGACVLNTWRMRELRDAIDLLKVRIESLEKQTKKGPP